MSRRRNYSDESSDEDDSHRRKRRRQAENIDIEERLESLITRVCEKSTSSLESNLEGLTTVLEADMANYKTKILKILLQCVLTMPENMTVYTTLVGLLNAKNYNAGGEFIELLVRQLKECLKTSQFDQALLVLRFLADLVNCRVVTVSSILTLFKTFVEVTHEIHIPQVRSDWFVFAVLSCLPWVGQEITIKKPQDVDGLLATIDAYIRKRQKIHVAALQVWSANESPPQEEYLDCLWAQIKALRGMNWEESEIPRPYIGFDGVLCDALQHSIPTVMLLSHDEDMVYPIPHVIFTLFEQQDMPSDVPYLPARHSLDRYLVDEHLHRALHLFHEERKDCAEALLTIPVKGKYPLNYMIVEAIFSQLFQLPRAPYLELFYGSLLIELCKLQPSSMPQVLAQATEIIFDKLESMHTSCIERFSSWFSYHLSNFQFKWSWDDWSDCLQQDEEKPKPKFIKETLLKCLRLSYHQRVMEIVPPPFAKLLPAKPVPNYKYENEELGTHPGTMISHRLMQSIKSKCSPEEVLVVLKELPRSMDDDEEDFNDLKIDVFVQTLLFLGAKSFSHSFAAISKFHPVLQALGDSRDARVAERAQISILKSLHELWKNHQQMMVVIIDKLLKIQVVKCSSVAAWIFSPEMSSELTSWYVWEILHSTIKKMNRQIAKLEKDIEDMKNKVRAHDRKKKDGGLDELGSSVPTDDDIEKEEEKLEEVMMSQKNLYLIVFQRFIILLSDHLSKCEAEHTDFATPWYKWMIDRLQQVFLLHHERVYKYVHTLETLVFTSDVDLHILEVFQQFCALRS